MNSCYMCSNEGEEALKRVIRSVEQKDSIYGNWQGFINSGSINTENQEISIRFNYSPGDSNSIATITLDTAIKNYTFFIWEDEILFYVIPEKSDSRRNYYVSGGDHVPLARFITSNSSFSTNFNFISEDSLTIYTTDAQGVITLKKLD